MDDASLSDDQPLYLPDEFVREHLDDARRSVANSRGGRAVARRVAAAVVPSGDPRRRRHLGAAVFVHVVAALLVLAMSMTTGTWAIGLTVVGLIGISLAVVVWVVNVLAKGRARDLAALEAQRSRQRRLR